jgi:predicted nuclease with TOPRIM domain
LDYAIIAPAAAIAGDLGNLDSLRARAAQLESELEALEQKKQDLIKQREQRLREEEKKAQEKRTADVKKEDIGRPLEGIAGYVKNYIPWIEAEYVLVDIDVAIKMREMEKQGASHSALAKVQETGMIGFSLKRLRREKIIQCLKILSWMINIP